MAEKISVLLVDDHILVRRGFRRILEDSPDVRVVGEAGDGDEAIRLARELHPQVVVMDCAMPNTSGLIATRKILEDDAIQVNPTCVRVPVFYGHSEAVHIETRDRIDAAAARALLEAAPGVVVVDERKPGGYPTPVGHASGKDPVFVGRIREDISHPNGLDLWIVSDNIRKGAALNAVQIAEILIREYL